MLEWSLIGLGIVAGGAGWAWTRSRQNRHAEAWTPVLNAVAAQHEGAASTGIETPGLRGSVDGLTVTVTLHDVHRGPEKTRAEADVALPDTTTMVRLHIAWDTLSPAVGLEHVPVIDVPNHGLDGELRVRADDTEAAKVFVTKAALDLVDVRREALAEALEVTVRGGYLQLSLNGMQAHEATLERVLTVAARLARLVDDVSAKQVDVSS